MQKHTQTHTHKLAENDADTGSPHRFVALRSPACRLPGSAECRRCGCDRCPPTAGYSPARLRVAQRRPRLVESLDNCTSIIKTKSTANSRCNGQQPATAPPGCASPSPAQPAACRAPRLRGFSTAGAWSRRCAPAKQAAAPPAACRVPRFRGFSSFSGACGAVGCGPSPASGNRSPLLLYDLVCCVFCPSYV